MYNNYAFNILATNAGLLKNKFGLQLRVVRYINTLHFL